MHYELAIIGTADTILGFKALGLQAFSVTDAKDVTALVERLAAETDETKPKYAVIFILEELAQAIAPDRYKKLTARPLPAIIPLPGPRGSTGFGDERLKKLVIQAVGTEI